MKIFDKELICNCCGKKSKSTVNYAGYEICSEECMSKLMEELTTKEILYLEKKDKEVNNKVRKWRI